MAVDFSQITQVDTEPGELPETMPAWVIREERFGEPVDAFQVEEIEVPEPGAFEVTVSDIDTFAIAAFSSCTATSGFVWSS